MSKREEGICIWIHHIATGLGIIMGTVGLAGWLRRPKRGVAGWLRGFLLGIFLLTQFYACLKILADIFHRCDKEEGKTERAEDRTSSLHGSFARIRRLCPGKREQRAAAWSALAAGVAFKLGVPALLGRR